MTDEVTHETLTTESVLEDVDFLDTPVEEPTKSDESKQEEKPVEEGKPEEAKENISYKIPEGYKEEDLDKELLTQFNEVAKKAGLSQDTYDTLFKKYAYGVEKYQEKLFEQVVKQQTEWKRQIENDAEIGGDNKDKTLLSINQMLKTVGGESEVAEFKKAMRETGAGNNPVIVKFLARASKMVTEGGYVTGGTVKNTPSGTEKYFNKIFGEMDSYKDAKQKG
jgi:hypothetical protein